MSAEVHTLHQSRTGDRWLLVPWPVGGRYRVVHVANARAGGHIAVLEVDAFLKRTAETPAVLALRKLFEIPSNDAGAGASPAAASS